jgi:hypothetical protein
MMRNLFIAFLLSTALPSAVFAEQLKFDHRLYPPLKDVFDKNRQEMIYFNNSDPKYVVDRIAVRGTSADDWTEALNIIARSRSRNVKSSDDWFEEIRTQAEKACPSRFEVVARDSNSITFSRRSTDCEKDKVQFALYRIVGGKRSLFLLNAVNRDDMTDAARQQWLALLQSARLEN